ncbi:MAG: hypothetical protein H8D22_07790 [Candidatus Cloacimonetes bacterium]|nr:hypothetical protein [Candidatus Cloacimonadota bacterium]
MNATKLLKQKGISFDYSALSITAEDVLRRLIETINEWELDIKLDLMKKEDLLKLIDSFGGAVIDYHPENDHQERAVLLKHSDMLEKYGLTEEDICRLDFC